MWELLSEGRLAVSTQEPTSPLRAAAPTFNVIFLGVPNGDKEWRHSRYAELRLWRIRKTAPEGLRRKL
jgi:hypothetical protein